MPVDKTGNLTDKWISYTDYYAVILDSFLFVETGLTFSGKIYLHPRLEIGLIKSESINTEEVEAFREGFFPFTDADKTFGRVFNFWWSITGHMFPTFIKYARDIKIPHVRLFKKTVS